MRFPEDGREEGRGIEGGGAREEKYCLPRKLGRTSSEGGRWWWLDHRAGVGAATARSASVLGWRSNLPKFHQAVRFAFRAELREAEAFRIGLPVKPGHRILAWPGDAARAGAIRSCAISLWLLIHKGSNFRVLVRISRYRASFFSFVLSESTTASRLHCSLFLCKLQTIMEYWIVFTHQTYDSS